MTRTVPPSSAGAIPVLPAVGPVPPLVLPPMADVRLPNGLRVVAVRHASIPMAELRLAVPLDAESFRTSAVHELVAATLLHGTPQREREAITDELATVGAVLSASRTSRWLGVSGSGPTAALPTLLGVLGECLVEARHEDAAVRAARERAVRQAATTRRQPHLLASEALLDHLYGPMPRMNDVPYEADLAAVTAEEVRAAHREVVRPDRAVLVLVGDLDPERAVARAAQALRGWSAAEDTRPAPCAPVIRRSGIARIHRPGAAQSQIRLARPAIDRNHPEFAALTLANIVFGGYFSSRLVADVRERHGLAYRCESAFRDHLDQLVISLEADTATESAAGTLRRIRHQLRSMAEQPPSGAEVEAARRYVTGMTALATSSQQAWASSLLLSLTLGQQPDRIAHFLDELATVSAADVAAAAGRWYDPTDYHGVVLGDTAHLTETDIAL
ncbi:insulinase family protein [Streptomyces sp. MK7]|uniref:M16 family metallopeptidase n=1 Tax=Streptomyces sp. MK7 TaxID=3067635 RepID=UPI00293009DF|nr:insulinase family protein [Streptomyces sp. MK7]